MVNLRRTDIVLGLGMLTSCDSAVHPNLRPSNRFSRTVQYKLLWRRSSLAWYTKLLMSVVVLLLGTFASSFVVANSTTYGCEEESNYKIAKVGVYSGNSVTVDEDSNDRACRFAVNGANVESPHQATVIEAINRIWSGQIRNFDDSRNRELLAFLTISASTMDQPPKELLELFRKFHKTMEGCFSGGSGDGKHNDFSFSCRIFKPGTQNSYHTTVRLPTLELIVLYPKNRRTRTYIPYRTIGSGRSPLPLNLR